MFEFHTLHATKRTNSFVANIILECTFKCQNFRMFFCSLLLNMYWILSEVVHAAVKNSSLLPAIWNSPLHEVVSKLFLTCSWDLVEGGKYFFVTSNVCKILHYTALSKCKSVMPLDIQPKLLTMPLASCCKFWHLPSLIDCITF